MNDIPRAILLDPSSTASGMEAALRDAGFRTFVATDRETALERCHAEEPCVLLASVEQLDPLRDLLDRAGPGSSVPPILALCRSASITDLEEARAFADDALAWPEGAPRLRGALEVLFDRAMAARELVLRRAAARLLQEISVLLGSNDELEFLLSDALNRVAETTEALRVFLVVIRPEQSLYYVAADTEEAAGITLPVPRDELPEVTECVATRRELLVRAGPGAGLEEWARSRGVGALLVEPLVADGEVFGVLELELELKPGAAERRSPFAPAFHELVRQASTLLGHALYSSDFYVRIGEQTKITVAKARGKKSERSEALKKYKEFFQRAFDGFIVLDGELRILHINPAGEQITGYARQGLIGKELREFVLDGDRPLLESMLKEMKVGSSTRSFDLGLVTPSGDPILVSVSPSAVLADEEALVLSFRDVTEARALENQLRSTKEFLERLVGSTVDAIVATDTEEYVILFNQGAERIFGLSPEDVLGKLTFSDLFPPEEAAKALQQLRGTGSGGEGRLEAARMEALHASKELIPVSLSANLLYEDGIEVGLVAIVSDLRERLLMEQQLVQVQERLIETEKQALIAELAGTAAHELNQPLTSVMGYAELLLRRISADDSNRRAAEVIIQEAERMAEIVRKIGRITRYEVKSYVGSTQILDLEKSSE